MLTHSCYYLTAATAAAAPATQRNVNEVLRATVRRPVFGARFPKSFVLLTTEWVNRELEEFRGSSRYGWGSALPQAYEKRRYMYDFVIQHRQAGESLQEAARRCDGMRGQQQTLSQFYDALKAADGDVRRRRRRVPAARAAAPRQPRQPRRQSRATSQVRAAIAARQELGRAAVARAARTGRAERAATFRAEVQQDRRHRLDASRIRMELQEPAVYVPPPYRGPPGIRRDEGGFGGMVGYGNYRDEVNNFGDGL